MAQSQQCNWEADKMLDVYIHDYMLKRGLHASAKTFMTEGKVATYPVAIDAPGGFLFEWWSVFWDIFIARTNEKHSEPAAAYIEAQQIKGKEHQQQLQMQQLQLLQQCNAQMQRRDPGHSSIGSPMNPLNSEGLTGQPSASVLAMKLYEERMKHPQSIDSDTSPSLIDANRLALLKSAANHQGQSMLVNSGSMSALQQMQSRNQLANDIKSEVNLSAAQKSLPMDPSSIYGQLQSKSVFGGLNQAVNNLPLKGWPLTGIDQLRPNLGLQAQKPVQSQNQLLLASQQQQVLQAQAQTNLGNSANHGDTDPRRFGGLPRSTSVKDGPSTQNDGSLCSSLQDDIDHFADVDNVESFLSNDGGDGRDQYGTLKLSPSNLKKESSKGFSFAEAGCIRTRNSKVTCCHFSSDGKLLASAGHDKKAVLWNMDNLQTQKTPEEHQSVITDIRFRPNSSQLATASYDKSVRLWDAANPSYHSQAYTTHSSPVMSIDFHPKKTDLFCFCDEKNEIHYWTLNPFTCSRISKGATAQLRFQPRVGQFLAAASDEVVSIFDVEMDRLTYSFQGHFDTVNSVCWDANGDFLASVSKDLVKIWSMTSGECTHEISSNGNQFHSCAFHPSYSTLLVIGGISSLELWNIAENKRMTVPAHDEMVAALAQSSISGMVASASHDGSVKIWK